MVPKIMFKIIASLTLLAFTATSVVTPNVSAGQISSAPVVSAVTTFQPPMIQGMTLYPDEPLRFDFILNEGDPAVRAQRAVPLQDEAMQLIKYFLAGLAIPEETMWVNLSPTEADRIIPETFGQTEMGQTLLAQDYILKKLTASLMNPETETGKVMWEKIYSKIYEKYSCSDDSRSECRSPDPLAGVGIESLNKVWIVPGKTSVYENTATNSVFVVESDLDVMMEEDYQAVIARSASDEAISEIASQKTLAMTEEMKSVIREIIIPAIKEEVNHGESFAPLRQIMNSLILATWYKNALKESVLTQGFADRGKLGGIASPDSSAKEKIYQQYLELFRHGVADVIKEDYDPATQTIVPRKYFTGGVMISGNWQMSDGGLTQRAMLVNENSVVVETNMAMNTPAVNLAMMSGFMMLLSFAALFGLIWWVSYYLYDRPHKGTNIRLTFLEKPKLFQGNQIDVKPTKERTEVGPVTDSLQGFLQKYNEESSGTDNAQMAKNKKDDRTKLPTDQELVKASGGVLKDVPTLDELRERDKKDKGDGLLDDLSGIWKKDKAMLEEAPGGIDVRKINVIVEKSGIGVATAFDNPEMLQQLKNSTGLSPVIFGIEKLQTPVFYRLLGLNADGTENDSDPSQSDSKTETAFIRQENL